MDKSIYVKMYCKENDNIKVRFCYPKEKKYFTPEECKQWVNHALNFTPMSEKKGFNTMTCPHNSNFTCKLLPILSGVRPDDPLSVALTEACSKVFFSEMYRIVLLKVYDSILEKMEKMTLIRKFWYDVRVVVKGSSALTLLYPNDPEFKFSDLDIMIYINPNLDDVTFYEIRNCVEIIVNQTLSAHKKILDNMFFMGNPHDNLQSKFLLDSKSISKFKHEYSLAMMPFCDKNLFSDTDMRNKASRHSFAILKHATKKDCITAVDIPFLEKCHLLPLHFSPLYITNNKTIDYVETYGEHEDQKKRSSFQLIRLKWNNLVSKDVADKIRTSNKINIDNDMSCEDASSEDEENKENIEENDKKVPSKKLYCISSEFIDVSIPNKDDTLAKEAWDLDNFIDIQDHATGITIQVPDVQACVRDLKNCLYKYKCPEGKREKRKSYLSRLEEYYKVR